MVVFYNDGLSGFRSVTGEWDNRKCGNGWKTTLVILFRAVTRCFLEYKLLPTSPTCFFKSRCGETDSFVI